MNSVGRKLKIYLVAGLFAIAAAIFLGSRDNRQYWLQRLARKTVRQSVGAICKARPEVREAARAMGGPLTIFVFKDERMVELSAPGWNAPRRYHMTGFSGGPGPKLREGDGQIPEGVYGVECLNPNSAFHLSLKVSYPNEFDRAQALLDGRDNLGGDIMIHGGSASVGCIPIGNVAIEEVFCFAAAAGRKNVRVIIAPYDMRGGRDAGRERSDVPWYGELCDTVAIALGQDRNL